MATNKRSVQCNNFIVNGIATLMLLAVDVVRKTLVSLHF